MNSEANILKSVLKHFASHKQLGDKTFAQLTEEQLHFRPNAQSNSIAIIIQHLHGNMLSRWTNFLTEDGEKKSRSRDAEFEPKVLTKDQLLQLWEEGWSVLFHALEQLTEADLSKTITIRSEPHSVIDAIIRQVAHYSYHVGQIVYLGKWMRGDLWESLSIPKDASEDFNRKMMGLNY
jgi:hypothetical protein